MPYDLLFRTDDLTKWGTGKGVNLLPSEVDDNFWTLLQKISQILASPVQPVQITGITFQSSSFRFYMSNATYYDVPFPPFVLQWRGEWTAGATYNGNVDVVSVTGQGIYWTLQTHVADATFDPNRVIGGQFVYALMMTSDVQPYDLSMYYSARILGDSSVLFQHVVARDLIMPANLPGSFARLRVGTSTALIYFAIEVNGTAVGSIDFGVIGSNPTVTFTNAVNLFAGDVLVIRAPFTEDATAEGLSVTLALTKV